MQSPSTNGLHRLYQQACRLACAAIERGDDEQADRFGTVARTLEGTLRRKSEAI